MDFSKQTFRCSSIGYIMTEPKGKSNLEKYNDALSSLKKYKDSLATTGEKAIKTRENLEHKIVMGERLVKRLEAVKDVKILSDTCKVHLCDIYTAVKYNRTEDIRSKYMEKGINVEEDSITLYSLITREFHKKNKERRYNDWIEGELDFHNSEKLVDTKSNWSIFQFNRVAARPIKEHYWWQLDGYMDLWNLPRAELAYCLINTPTKLIESEKKKLLYDFLGSEEEYREACLEIERLHTYDDIPDKEKIRIFQVTRDEERIERIHRRVEECREFLNNLENKIPVEYETED